MRIICPCTGRNKSLPVITSKGQIASQTVEYIGQLYGIEQESREMTAEARYQLRQTRAKPIAEALHT